MHQETYFEQAMEQSLIERGGFERGDAGGFDPARALFPDEVITFVAASQPQRWQSLVNLHGDQAGEVLLGSLVKELATKNALHVLRHGFKCFGKTFRLAYFAPNTGMNPEATEAYAHNRLRVTRQLHFSEKHPHQSLDMVLSVNGLPVVTLELKNPMTGQTADDAIVQYKKDRSPEEPLLRFKERTLVHFAVDPDQAFMATQLAGEKTVFLPFNRGHHYGAGNPPAEVSEDGGGGYRTGYLWEQVLTRDSLMDILARFLHLEVSETRVTTKKGVKRQKRETLIFPRYHQLDAVRKLIDNARAQGPGHNYLVQHSAGSGKSNSIAWLAHRLSNLHDEADNKVFDTVVVITDRRVLDQQLQNTIYQFEHKQGVVQKIDENTQQLAQALSSGVPIVISTIQKFPFITQAMDTLAKKGEAVELNTGGKRFAVIVDEAHSSQSGETAMELRKVLNHDGIESAIAEELLDVEEEDLSEEARKALFAEMLKRPRQPNISFFAFTATPKFKTQAVFNEPGPNGEPPFHLYSMRQAIEEGFIMDVLENYTTYKAYHGLIKAVEHDPQVPKRKAAKALARFASLHPHNIAQKVEVIVEHFRQHTSHRIGGRAKAMVVTASRLHAVRYKQAFDAYITKKKQEDERYGGIRSLVAFSGSVTDPDFPDHSYTEVGMNEGIKESELPEQFDTDHYQVLLVAEKYQTGFDQPLLHTMYVDRRLAGIQAVQTLSRLNRTARGKVDTFVLDFVNEREEIHKAFKPYYEVTPPGEPSDPQQLYDLQHRLEEHQVFTDDEVNAFVEIWSRRRTEHTPADHQKINAVLDQAVERYKALDEEQQDQFKGQLASLRNLYGFMAQIIPYQDSSLEKLYSYARFLLSKLPRDADDTAFELEDEVSLQYYRLQKISEGSIDLGLGEAPPLYGPTEVGTGRAEEEIVELSTLVGKLNERFGTEFTAADQLFFDQIAASAVENDTLREAAEANTRDNFAYVFNRMLENLLVERMDGNEEIFGRLMNDDDFRRIARDHLLHEVYDRLNTPVEGVQTSQGRAG